MRAGSVLVLCGLLGLASSAAQAKTQAFEAGNWYGAAQFNDDSGVFELCYISGSYRSDISVFFQIDYDGAFHVAFEHPDWRLKKGDSYPVVLEVDRVFSERYRAVAYSETGVDIGFDQPGALLDILRRGHEMRVHAQRDTFKFLLTGTMAALKELQDCYDRNGRTSTAKANPFGGGSGDNPFGAPAQEEAGGAAATSPDNAAFRQKAASIFEAVMQDGRLSQFKLLHGSDIPDWLRNSDLAWMAGSAYGSLYADLGETTLEEQTSRITADDSKMCEGDVASAAVNARLDNGLLVRRLAISCVGEDSWYDYYSIYQTTAPDGAWVVRHFDDASRAAAKSADQAVFDTIYRATGGRGS